MRARISPAFPAFTASGLTIENVRSFTICSFTCFFLRALATAAPMSAGELTTWMPAACMAFIFSSAVPLPPEMIAPAWPMRRPGGAVWPAMKPTTGFFTFSFT